MSTHDGGSLVRDEFVDQLIESQTKHSEMYLRWRFEVGPVPERTLRERFWLWRVRVWWDLHDRIFGVHD